MSGSQTPRWTRAAEQDGAATPTGDLYFDWGLATDWAGQDLPGEQLWVPLLAPVDARWRAFTAKTEPTAWRAGLAPLTASSTESQMPAPWCVLWVHRDVASSARRALPDAEASQPRAALLPPSPYAGVEGSKSSKPANKPPALVMAAIDGGGAFLNRVFREADDPARTRFFALWDQDRDAEPGRGPWNIPAAGYGRELRAAALQSLCQQADLLPEGERTTYAALGLDDLLLSDALGRADHATHVLDTLAGLPSATPLAACSKPDHLDHAAQAPLILVSTPRAPALQTTGAPTIAQVLDGLHYILARAAELGPDCPVVVNISLGMLGGPHDGSSALEQAVDALMQRHPKLLVVLAAGNTGDEPAYDVAGTLDPKQQARLSWRLQPHDPTDSFFELWWKGAGAAGLQVRLQQPYASPWVAVGQCAELRRDQRLLGQLALQTRRGSTQPDAGRGQLSLAPVEGPRGGLPAGQWRLQLRNVGAEPVQLRGWVQGDGPRWTLAAPVQSRLDGAGGGLELGAAGSLNGLATGHYPLVVGAARDDDGQRSPYSSQPGACIERKVDALALADEGSLAPGLMAAGVLSGTWVRMSGTSVATPVAARHWAQRAVDLGVPTSGETWRQRLLPRTRGDNTPPIRPARRA